VEANLAMKPSTVALLEIAAGKIESRKIKPKD